MSKFKVGNVVKRKDGLTIGNETWGDTLSETAVVIKTKDGRNYLEGKSGPYSDWFLELVSRSPVRVTTVVKKEIIPGIYGDVEISSSGVIYVSPICGTGKKRLAEAIKTLQQIHDAIE